MTNTYTMWQPISVSDSGMIDIIGGWHPITKNERVKKVISEAIGWGTASARARIEHLDKPLPGFCGVPGRPQYFTSDAFVK